MPIRLYVKDSGQLVGEITPAQLKVLVDLLEEEDSADQDYYVDKDLLEMFAEEGVDKDLIRILEKVVPDDDGVEVEWREE